MVSSTSTSWLNGNDGMLFIIRDFVPGGPAAVIQSAAAGICLKKCPPEPSRLGHVRL